MLITCGLMSPSAILIYDWALGEVIVSTRVMSPTQDLLILQGNTSVIKQDKGESDVKALQDKFSTDIIDGFVIVSLETLVIFVYSAQKNEFKTSYVSFE